MRATGLRALCVSRIHIVLLLALFATWIVPAHLIARIAEWKVSSYVVFPIGGHYYTAEVNTVESGANESKQARMDLLKSVKPLKKSGDKKDETDDDDSD